MAGFRPQFAWPALVVLAVTTVLTVMASFGVWFYFQSRLEAHLEAELQEVAQALGDRLGTYAQTLRGVRAHMYSEQRVDRAEFATYARRLGLERNYPGFEGIGFAVNVSQTGIAALKRELAKDDTQRFDVWPPGDRPAYAPVVYLEPFNEENRQAYGFDMLSSPERRAALERARDTGLPALSAVLPLAQDTGMPDQPPGFLLVLPVYGGDEYEPLGREERRKALVGYVYGSFRAAEFFSRAFAGLRLDFDVSVSDAQGAPMYSSAPGARASLAGRAGAPAVVSRESALELFGRRWRVTLQPGPFSAVDRIVAPLLTFVGGLMLAFVLFRVTEQQSRQRMVAERLLFELRTSQTALENSNRQTNDILESISDAFLSCDKGGRLLYANRQACAIFGKPLEDLIAMPIQNLLPEYFPPLVERVTARGLPAEAEVRTAQGAWLEVHGYPSASGGAFYIRDVSRRKRDELALEESEQRYKSLFLYSPDPVFALDLQGRFTGFNPAAEHLSGFPWTEVVGQPFLMLLDPDEAARTAAHFQAVSRGESVAFETAIRSKRGRRLDLLVMGGPVVVAGKIEGVFGFAKDITQARAAERKLAESEERYRLVVEGSYDGVWDWDLRSGAVYWSDRLLEIVGLTRAEWQARPATFEELLHPEERERVARLKQDHLEHGAEYRAEMRLRHASGAYRTCLVRGKAQRDAGGNPVRMAGTVTDITDRKRFESTLAFLADASASLSATLDPADVFRTLTRLGVPFLGDGAAAFLRGLSGEVYVEASHPSARCAADMRRVIDAVAHGLEARRGTLSAAGPVLLQPASPRLPAMLRFDDEARAAWERLAPRAVMSVPLIRRGKPAGLVAYVALTSKRLYGDPDMAVAEELARRASLAFENAVLYRGTQEAVRARDEFLSVASHELKTPVTSIHLQIQLLLEVLHRQGIAGLPSERLENALQNTDRQVSRLVRLINELLDVSRLTTGNLVLERDEVDLTALVEETVGRLRPSSASPIAFESHGPIVGRWDRLRLEQVVTNLVSNASKYGAGKPVTVAVTASGGMARISVCDRGIGIEEADLDRIFNRFERAVTEKQFGGLGMGLYIVKQIVQAHGGEIHVVSRPGAGSTFIVDLPVAG